MAARESTADAAHPCMAGDGEIESRVVMQDKAVRKADSVKTPGDGKEAVVPLIGRANFMTSASNKHNAIEVTQAC